MATNEITAMTKLLRQSDLKGTSFALDALGYPKKIALPKIPPRSCYGLSLRFRLSGPLKINDLP